MQMMSLTKDNALNVPFPRRRKVTVKSINMHAHVAALLATDVIADAIISVFTILLFKF